MLGTYCTASTGCRIPFPGGWIGVCFFYAAQVTSLLLSDFLTGICFFPGVWLVSKSFLQHVWVRSESQPPFTYTLSSGLRKSGQFQRLPKTILNCLLSVLTGLSCRMECFAFPQSSGSDPSNALTL